MLHRHVDCHLQNVVFVLHDYHFAGNAAANGEMHPEANRRETWSQLGVFGWNSPVIPHHGHQTQWGANATVTFHRPGQLHGDTPDAG